jgi:hypothetical protein
MGPLDIGVGFPGNCKHSRKIAAIERTAEAWSNGPALPYKAQTWRHCLSTDRQSWRRLTTGYKRRSLVTT